MSEQIEVRHVCGRYPRHSHATLQSENIEVRVEEIARVFRIHVDDTAHEEMWLELVVEVMEDRRDES